MFKDDVRKTLPECERLLSEADYEMIGRLNESAASFEATAPWTCYTDDPIGYCRDILGVVLTPDQENIVLALLDKPNKVHVDSGHNTGKTYLAACIVNWFYDSHDPGVIVTTAPTFEHIASTLWGAIRILRAKAKAKFPGLPLDLMPSKPEMKSSPEHFAVGLTANKGEAFQGKHPEFMLFVFDEAEGLALTYFSATVSMFQPGGKHLWLSVDNPTSVSSPAYLETRKTDGEGNPIWNLFRLSSLDHPNIPLTLDGKPPLVDRAVTAGQIDEWINAYYCAVIDEKEATPPDFLWRGKWYHPGPEAESRILGLRPSQGTSSIWNDALWSYCEKLPMEKLGFPINEMPEIGCDVARVLGGDDCDTHVRWGGISLKHDSANGRPIPATIAKLKELADWVAEFANEVRKVYYDGLKEKVNWKPFYGHQIPVKIDDCGIGGAVSDFADEYRFIPINSGMVNQEVKYPNLRSELWFETMERARLGGLCLAHLAKDDKRAFQKLRLQAVAPMWSQDARQRRLVEPKVKTKERLGGSPDAMDAMNLAYMAYGKHTAKMIGPDTNSNDSTTSAARLGLLGRGLNSREDRDIGRRERERSQAIRTLGRGGAQ